MDFDLCRSLLPGRMWRSAAREAIPAWRVVVKKSGITAGIIDDALREVL
jgi:hypothetical protein